MSIPVLPTLPEILSLTDAQIAQLDRELEPIVTLVHRLRRAETETEPPAPTSETPPSVSRLKDVDLHVERVNPSGRVIFNVPGHGPAAHQLTKATRRKLARVRPGDVVRARLAEVAIRALVLL